MPFGSLVGGPRPLVPTEGDEIRGNQGLPSLGSHLFSIKFQKQSPSQEPTYLILILEKQSQKGGMCTSDLVLTTASLQACRPPRSLVSDASIEIRQANILEPSIHVHRKCGVASATAKHGAWAVNNIKGSTVAVEARES